MGFGRGPVPKGYLPVFSVNTDEEAQQLIALTCPKNYDGRYYARESAEKQTLESLAKFSRHLERAYKWLKESEWAKRGRDD